jgi:hypothetical protein
MYFSMVYNYSDYAFVGFDGDKYEVLYQSDTLFTNYVCDYKNIGYFNIMNPYTVYERFNKFDGTKFTELSSNDYYAISLFYVINDKLYFQYNGSHKFILLEYDSINFKDITPINYPLRGTGYVTQYNNFVYLRSDTNLYKLTTVQIPKNTINGNFIYNNNYNSPLKNVKLYLINSEDKRVDSTNTDSTGHYGFINVKNDTYTIEPIITIKWDGVNPNDALIINRAYIWIYAITDNLFKSAADVNGDSKVNPTDALMVNRRYIKMLSKYNIPDWLYEKPVITIKDNGVIQDIRAVCAGDIDGSYEPK